MPFTERPDRSNQDSPIRRKGDKNAEDIHDWISYHHPHDKRIYRFLDPEITEFYNRLRPINRNDFFVQLSTRVSSIKSQQSIVETLYTNYEAAYLLQHQNFHTTRRSTQTTSTIPRNTSAIVLQRQQIEVERQVLDLIRSWKSYLDEWVLLAEEISYYWEEIWDWFEYGLYSFRHDDNDDDEAGDLPDFDRRVELLKGLRGLEVRADFARKGAMEKGERVLSLGCV